MIPPEPEVMKGTADRLARPTDEKKVQRVKEGSKQLREPFSRPLQTLLGPNCRPLRLMILWDGRS